MEMKKIKEVFEDLFTKNIMSYIKENCEIFDEYSSLDLLYASRSGDKWVSPIIINMLEEDSYLTEEDLTKLAKMLLDLYETKWQKIGELLKEEYNPIENYRRTEVYDLNDTRGKTGENKVASTSENKDSSDDDVYAFNSSAATPSDKNYSESSGSSNETYTFGEKETFTKGGKMEAYGNIGVTTSQQMMEEEIRIREYLFIEKVMEDIDKIITLSVY